MITKWRLENFKSVRHAEVTLKPLTVLSGVNSSGKSTLFQSMALIAQTVANQLETRPLLLNGHMTALGELKTVCSLGAAEFATGWDLAPRDTSTANEANLELAGPYATQETFKFQTIACDVVFDSEDPMRGADVRRGTLRVMPTNEEPASCDWTRRSTVDASAHVAEWSIRFDESSSRSVRERFFDAAEDGCDLRHFLPVRLRLRLSRERVDADVRARVLCGKRRVIRPEKNELLVDRVPERAAAFLAELVDPKLAVAATTFSDWLTVLNQQRATHPSLSTDETVATLRDLLLDGEPRSTETVPTYLPGVLPEAVFYTETFFGTKFRYLGPLRDEPRSVYPHPNKLDPVDLGRRGEFTAAAYHALRSDSVLQIDIGELKEFGPLASTHAAPLQQAVDEWVRYLEVAHHVMSQEDKYGHVLLVGTSQTSDYEMAHVGTGVSQVLPILVLGLLSQLDDTLVIEHPELHLHPSVQTRLADFFLFLALTGRQVLVETHSEYIINRLRYRMVAPGGETIREQVGILFATTNEDGATTFEEVVVSPYGAIERWPDGFFDEAAREAEEILRAALRRGDGEAS